METNAFGSRLCLLCHSVGTTLYNGLTDKLFGSTGKWNIKQCSNPSCALLWLDPMPLEENINDAYDNYYTHTEITSDRENTWLHKLLGLMRNGYLANKYNYNSIETSSWENILGRFLYLYPPIRETTDSRVMYLPAKQGGKLLEIGCGNGNRLEIMKKLGWQVEGIDFDPVAVKFARKNNLTVHLGKLETQNYPDNHFDAITMSHLIEHTHDPLLIFRECNRILKTEGRLVCVTPNSASWGHKIFKHNWRGLEPPRHLYIFNPATIADLARRAGFKNARVITSIRSANSIFLESKSLQSPGKYNKSSPINKIIGRLWQLIEWAMHKFRPTVGEELVLIIEK